MLFFNFALFIEIEIALIRIFEEYTYFVLVCLIDIMRIFKMLIFIHF